MWVLRVAGNLWWRTGGALATTGMNRVMQNWSRSRSQKHESPVVRDLAVPQLNATSVCIGIIVR